MLRVIVTFYFIFLYLIASYAQKDKYISDVWVSDQRNGTYKNPILFADYSDPDVCRVGDDYYMTSSSFNCVPALQILHSKDLINWTIIGAAISHTLVDESLNNSRPEHGNCVWAPSIRFHNGHFYIFWGDPDRGIFMTKSIEAKGPWSKPVLIKKGNGFIDPCPFWDDNGEIYLAHAYAGSRAGINGLIAVCQLDSITMKAKSPSKIVYDGHIENPTCEGPKIYKRNGYYYIFISAGGVPIGWQSVLRSRSLYGPYETRIVLSQGDSQINGPRQGAWVETSEKENWYFHFQDVGAYGRVVHLQPLSWVDDWPVIGVDKDGDGCGEPVLEYRKPKVKNKNTICTPQENDEFDGFSLSPQWQWHGNIDERWAYFAGDKGLLRLYSFPVAKDYKNLWDVSNLLLQKTPSNNFVVTTKLTFSPSGMYSGERAGLLVMGLDYAGLILEKTKNEVFLSQVKCLNAEIGSPEEHSSEKIKITENKPIFLRMRFVSDGTKIPFSKGGHDLLVLCDFSYSFDGKKFVELGNTFQVKEGKWIGAKVGLFCSRPSIKTVDGGWVDVDWFRFSKK